MRITSALFCFVGKKMSLGWRGSQGSLFTFQNVMKISRTRNLFSVLTVRSERFDCAYLFVFGMSDEKAKKAILGSIEVKMSVRRTWKDLVVLQWFILIVLGT